VGGKRREKGSEIKKRSEHVGVQWCKGSNMRFDPIVTYCHVGLGKGEWMDSSALSTSAAGALPMWDTASDRNPSSRCSYPNHGIGTYGGEVHPRASLYHDKVTHGEAALAGDPTYFGVSGDDHHSESTFELE